jgi:hypothetical protein
VRGSSKTFQTTSVRSGQTAICRVDVIREGRVVAQLTIHRGSVTADRTAAQMRNFEVEVSDPDGVLTPEGMASLLAPFGTRLQLWRGLRLQDVTSLVFYANSAPAWQVTTPQGQMNGVVGDLTTGELRLGP